MRILMFRWSLWKLDAEVSRSSEELMVGMGSCKECKLPGLYAHWDYNRGYLVDV